MRLTKTRTRTGNSGFTELIKGHRIPKSDSICFINNEIQKAAVLIQFYIHDYKHLLDAKDLELLSTLVNPESNKLIGSLWAKLELSQLVPDNNLIIEFEERLSEINSQFKSAQEFVVFKSIAALEFYYITLFFRNIEHFVWVVVHRFYSFTPENYTDEVNITGSFYNLLGDYLFNLTRLIEKKMTSTEEYWQNPLAPPETSLIISDDTTLSNLDSAIINSADSKDSEDECNQ
jgi:cob(I)alamin adenosyltransferase